MTASLPRAWVIGPDWDSITHLAVPGRGHYRRNNSEIEAARAAWARYQLERGGEWRQLPPEGTWHLPVSELAFERPDDPFAPDCLHMYGDLFVSERLLQAMALPADEAVVQVRPAVVVEGPPEAHARGYRWLHVVAEQPAMDPEPSGSQRQRLSIPSSGRVVEYAGWPKRLVFRPDFVPRTDLLRCAELETTLLATDALALRVLAAGCTGIDFVDPLTAFDSRVPRRVRTLEGVVERRG